jgi:hypothetical protein
LKGYVSLRTEQADSLSLLIRYHGTGPSIWQIEHGHLQVEFLFGTRYYVTLSGEIYKVYDIERDACKMIDERPRLIDAVKIIEA